MFDKRYSTTGTTRRHCHCDWLNGICVTSASQQINRFLSQALISEEINDGIIDIRCFGEEWRVLVVAIRNFSPEYRNNHWHDGIRRPCEHEPCDHKEELFGCLHLSFVTLLRCLRFMAPHRVSVEINSTHNKEYFPIGKWNRCDWKHEEDDEQEKRVTAIAGGARVP